jgi:DNA (cytosine-5)-methyltransferase 3A
MRVLSLFDGMGGARQALKDLNIQVKGYVASEINKYATKISKKNHSDITHVGDITNVDTTINFIFGPFDLIIGGSPCQELSIAKNNRKGLAGTRSGLFWEMARIISEFKPKYFFVENVASMSKESKSIITRTLGVEPILINSALLTAQNRKRLYWTNIPNVSLPKDKHVYLKDILDTGFTERNKAFPITRTYANAVLRDYFYKSNRQLVFNKPVKITYIGKGGQAQRIYSIEGKSVTLSANGGGAGAKTGLYAIPSTIKPFVRKLTPIECEILQGLKDNYTEGVSNTQRYKMIGNGFTIPIIAHILSFIKGT